MKLIGIARLGKDAELRYTPNGRAVANLSLAYNYGQKDGDGNRSTQWVEAALWGDQAERLSQHLLKATVLNVTCRDVHIETFEGRNGTGHKLVGTVADIEFVPKQRADTDGNGSPSPSHKPAAAQQRPSTPPAASTAPKQQGGGFSDFDDDIPF
jgi:single-strand DNA-binding protein